MEKIICEFRLFNRYIVLAKQKQQSNDCTKIVLEIYGRNW